MSSPSAWPGRKNFAKGTLLLLSVIFFTNSCKNKNHGWIDVDPGFARYVEAYTTGVVSKTTSVRIQLAADAAATHTVGQPVTDKLFDLSPSVKGTATWLDARTIEFKPEKNLEPDQLYEVDFKLGKVTDVPSKYKELKFNLQTVRPSFKVSNSGLRSDGSKDKMFLNGEVNTADVEDGKQIEKVLTVTQNSKVYPIIWQHANAKTHAFTINGIVRTGSMTPLMIAWNGKQMNIDVTGNDQLEVPAAGDFKILAVMPVNDAQQYASVQFTDPIAVGQDLTGLVTISNEPDISYAINGSEIKLFSGKPLEGNYTVNVNPGIKNIWGASLTGGYTSNVVFENKKPSVKILGKGNILPNSGKLVLPFDAINLSAVDISIIKIFENNVPQFLQQNGMDGDQELRRVAKPIVQKTLRLDDDKTLDLHQKQRFSLDIDKFLKTEPGAIYRVTIGFRPAYSLYSKATADTTANDEGENNDEGEGGYGDESYNSGEGQDNDDEFWSAYDNFYPNGYNWERKDDPASKSYYNKDRWATRNILASNIGLTVKKGNDNALTVAVSSIISTEPMSGVELLVMDYQNQVIGKGNSSSDGFATIDLKQKPYLLIAKKGTERGYLKLDDGSTLPLSRFDVSGEEIKNGIKGFIFGERGVWRPGDSLFINCILQDETGNLPDDMPIEFNLINPQGQLYKKMVQSNGTDGFNIFKATTDASSPTGNWLVKIKAGGAVFEKRIKIETVMPNRLKINLDFGKDAVLGVNSTNNGTLNSMWLFGSPGKNLKAKIDASLYARDTKFTKFPDYQFDDPTSKYSTQLKTIFDGTLDENGNAAIKPDFQTDGAAPGMLTASLLTKVFEPGGAFSIDNMTVQYSPYRSYAGLKLPDGEKPFDYLIAGKDHTVQIVDVDAKGNLLAGSQGVEVQFYKIQWRWWWDAGGDNLSNFTQDEYNKLIRRDDVTLSNGKGSWTFRTGNNEWGRYLILIKDKASGHITGSTLYVDDASWQTRAGEEDQSAASMLSFKADKDKYNVGDDVNITVPSAKGGRMLVSLESGSKVIKTFWQETAQGQTTVKFKAETGMAPNIYATISLLQPHAQTVNDLPIRMYGSMPIFIEDKNTVLTPQINMPESVRPESNVSVSVSEKNGKPMTYCIAVVDEGLLDLTHFKTPDPHAAFYAREALGVKSFDMFDLVIGAWGGDLERILTIGGDEDAGPSKQKTANRFKPVVKYLGPFTLGSGEKQTKTFIMPNYIGSVRTMVVAAHKGGYGFAEKAVTVKKPLMVLATMPRVLSPGETIKLPVTVFAMENNIKNVTVSMQPNNFLEVIGSPVQTLNFAKTGEQLAYFDVRVRNAVGIGKMKVNVSSGSEKATDEIELDVRNPNPVITNVQQITLSPGQKWDASVMPVGIASAGTSVMELSNIPSMNLKKRLSYLIEYPHGCIEQTTSAVFPQLVLKQLTDLNDFQKASVDKNVKAGLGRLFNLQRPNGGFSYWPGEGEADDWGSSYAGHFLVEAQNNGFAVSDYMLAQWKNYQRGKANSWVPSTTNFYGGDLAQAYRLYTLALAKAPELGAMNRLKEFSYLSAEAKWRLAAAYKLAGKDNVALDLISGLSASFTKRINPGFTYGSDLRDEAMVLETLTIMGQRSRAATVLSDVAARLSQDEWYSTQTTAYSLIAIAKYCGKNPSGAKIIASANLAGKPTEVNSASYLSQLPITLKDGSNGVSVINRGSNVLYVKIITQGQPLTGDTIKTANNSGALSMNVSYVSQSGAAVDITHLEQGTDFVAKVTVKNTGNRGTYTQMALSQIFPSGWEILNPRMSDGEGAFKSSSSTYQDVRDDRVYTYFNIRQGETLTYYVQLNSSYPGRYFLAATDCRAMYDNTISAATNSKWVEVLNGK